MRKSVARKIRAANPALSLGRQILLLRTSFSSYLFRRALRTYNILARAASVRSPAGANRRRL
jgi:hypothetical protein